MTANSVIRWWTEQVLSTILSRVDSSENHDGMLGSPTQRPPRLVSGKLHEAEPHGDEDKNVADNEAGQQRQGDTTEGGPVAGG